MSETQTTQAQPPIPYNPRVNNRCYCGARMNVTRRYTVNLTLLCQSCWRERTYLRSTVKKYLPDAMSIYWNGEALQALFDRMEDPECSNPPKTRKLCGIDPQAITLTEFFKLARIGETDALVTKRATTDDLKYAWSVFTSTRHPTLNSLAKAKNILNIPGVTHNKFVQLHHEYAELRKKRDAMRSLPKYYHDYDAIIRYIHYLHTGEDPGSVRNLCESPYRNRLFPGRETCSRSRRYAWDDLYRSTNHFLANKLSLQQDLRNHCPDLLQNMVDVYARTAARKQHRNASDPSDSSDDSSDTYDAYAPTLPDRTQPKTTDE